MSHWSILGSGVTGLCVATALHELGEKIEIISDPQHIAASHWAGGMLAPFCEGESAPTEVTQHGAMAIDWWNIHTRSVQRHGTLVIAPQRDQVELQRFSQRTTAFEWIKPAQIESDLTQFSKGLFFPSEAHLDPRLALHELKHKLIADGVAFHSGHASGKVIDCRGMHAKQLCKNLRAVRGEMLILKNPYIQLQRPVRLLHPRFPCYLVPRDHQHFMLGATMLESDNPAAISVRSMMELLGAAYSIHPSFADAEVIETGVGLRPSYPDNIPKMSYVDGRFHLNGMYRHGFLFAPILATQFIQHIQGHQA